MYNEFANIFSFLLKPLDKRNFEDFEADQMTSPYFSEQIKCLIAYNTWIEETKDTNVETIYESLKKMIDSPPVCDCDCLKRLVTAPEPVKYCFTKEAEAYRRLHGLGSLNTGSAHEVSQEQH